MSANTTLFQIEVRLKNNGFRKMFHRWARTPQQAANRVKKYGRPMNVQKVHADEMFGNFEKLLTNDATYMEALPDNSAIAIDEVVFKDKK